jgi:transcription elongation factor Elf1
MHYFNPICEFITIRFICPDCKKEVVSDALSVPSPDFAAENNSDSMNYEDYEVECENCGRSFQVNVYNSMYDGEVEVEDVDEMEVDEEYPEGDGFEDYVFDLTPERITSVIDEIDPLSSVTKEFLYRQLYAGTITSMEAFLSSTLIKEVLSSDENKRKFVEGYIPYQDEKISFSDIYKKIDAVDEVVQETLRGLMYHNLGKIKPIYKEVLNIDLGDIREIMKAVQIRHDIVHRSGKDKDGNMHIISKEDIVQLVENVSSLISLVEGELKPDSYTIDSIDDELRFELPGE